MSATATIPSLNPADWHRRLCLVNDWLAVSGDLDTDAPDEARHQLQSWVDAGVTDILDVRGEWHDREFVAAVAPTIRYHWLGTHDNGGGQSNRWFAEGLKVGRSVRDSGGRVLVHCHMGVNRAPSMAFRLLLDEGVEPIPALDAIRAARPIAGLLYADDALDHHHRSTRATTARRRVERAEMNAWFDEHPVDVALVISRIRIADHS